MSEIGQMTMQDVKRLATYMKANPSTRQLVQVCAAALGVKIPEPEQEKPPQMGIAQARAWAAAATRGMVEPNG